LNEIIESHVSSLHQEGATEEAAELLIDYASSIEDQKDSSGPVNWCYMRAAKFYFYLAEYEKSLELLNKCTITNMEFKVNLISTCLELGLFEKAQGIVDTMKKIDKKPADYLARTNYLITCAANFTPENCYSLTMKICRKRPQRQEGQREEAEADFERKISQFYLVTTFENPADAEAPIVVEQEVSDYDFTVVSPAVTDIAPQTGYLVKMDMYLDSSKNSKISSHWQIVFRNPKA